MKTYLMIASSLFILGCAPETFPADYLYTMDPVNNICEQYKIDKQKVTFQFEKELPCSEVGVLYGFKEKEVGHVMNYVRRVKKKAEACGATN